MRGPQGRSTDRMTECRTPIRHILGDRRQRAGSETGTSIKAAMLCATDNEIRTDQPPTASAVARQRMLATRGEPVLLADWERVLMIHFEVNADALQHVVPFPLDLRDGRAFVSVVAFTMRRMRPRIGGWLGAWLFKPLAAHEFLNVRTYVRHNGETGIHFLAEWLPNRLSVLLGPRTFALPYRLGRLRYEHHHETGEVRGDVVDVRSNTAFHYLARVPESACFGPCPAGSLDEWLMERYAAFNAVGTRRRCFHVWHQPWPQVSVTTTIHENSLLTAAWPFFREARLVGANYSPGVREVWMGRLRKISGL